MGSSSSRARSVFFIPATLALIAVAAYLILAERSAAPDGGEPITETVQVGGDVIAVVNGEAITEQQWLARVDDVSPAQSRRLLASELRRRAVLAQAEKAGYYGRPEVRKRIEETLVASYLNEELKTRLAAIRVSDAELEDHLLLHPVEAVSPRRRIAILLKEIKPGVSKQDAYAELQAAGIEAEALDLPIQHFGSLAARHSDHRATRMRGGVLGYFGPDHSEYDLVPAAVHAAAMALESPGAISDVIETGDALYLVRFVDELVSRGTDRESQLALIRERLRQAKLDAARDAFFQEIEALAGVQIADGWQAEELPPRTLAPPPSPIAQNSNTTEPQR